MSDAQNEGSFSGTKVHWMDALADKAADGTPPRGIQLDLLGAFCRSYGFAGSYHEAAQRGPRELGEYKVTPPRRSVRPEPC